MKNPVLIFGLVFVAGIAAYLAFNRPEPVKQQKIAVMPIVEPEASTSIADEKAKDKVPETPLVTAPQFEPVSITVAKAESLDNSDDAVKAVMEVLNPSLLQWFNQQELVRKIVMAVDRVAMGEVPSSHLPMDYHKPAFKVQEIAESSISLDDLDNNKRFVANRENYQRFKPLISALNMIPPSTLAAYYHDWQEIFEQAYAEMGMEISFNTRLHQAVDQVLAAPMITTEVVMTQPHVFYQYQNPELEQANAIHKFLWRTGAENMRALQRYLQALKPLL